jgi:hypothetical protein
LVLAAPTPHSYSAVWIVEDRKPAEVNPKQSK